MEQRSPLDDTGVVGKIGELADRWDYVAQWQQSGAHKSVANQSFCSVSTLTITHLCFQREKDFKCAN